MVWRARHGFDSRHLHQKRNPSIEGFFILNRWYPHKRTKESIKTPLPRCWIPPFVLVLVIICGRPNQQTLLINIRKYQLSIHVGEQF